MTRRLSLVAAVTVTALLTAGCGSLLAPRPNRTRFYFLSPAAEASDANKQASDVDLTVGLGPLKLPDYLNRTQQAVRVGPNQIRFLEDDRWAEALDANVVRVLSQNLTARLGNVRVLTLPTFLAPPRAYDVPLEILRFESTASGDAELSARWGIKDGKTDTLLVTAETHLVEPATGSGADAAVAALSRALGHWSDEIGAALTRVRAAQPPSTASAADKGAARKAKKKSSRGEQP
ncbi:MAG: membrane integrity-associated transporter subunit PqiC [Candidatus Binatia bacterium]